MVKSTKSLVAVTLVFMLIIGMLSVGSIGAAATTTENQTTSSTIVYGDVTGDGRISLSDLLEIRKYTARLVTFSDAQIAAADVSADGRINISDAYYMYAYIGRQISEFPADTKPTEPPTTTQPTEPPTTTQPTTCAGATVNGEDACVGDQVTFTVKLKTPTLVAAIDANVTYTGSVLKFAQSTLDAPKSEILPILSKNGSSDYNFEPITGEDAFYFNAADASNLYSFVEDNSVLVTLTFDVIAQGNANIDFNMTQIISDNMDSQGIFEPITDYEIIEETVVKHNPVAPTDPQPTDPQPTDPQPTDPQPTVPAQTATVNGKTAQVGDTVTYTAYLDTPVTLAGLSAKVNFTGSVLQYSNDSLQASNATIAPIAGASGSFVKNFYPTSGTGFLFNAADAGGSGYNFNGSDKVLVTLTFNVVAAGNATISLDMQEIYGTSAGYPTVTDYEVKEVVTVNGSPVEPTDPQPTVPGKATVNGNDANVGDKVTYTAYLDSAQLVGGIDAKVTYTNGILKYDSATLSATNSQISPVLSSSTGQYVSNFYPSNGESAFYFNAVNSEAGYNFNGSNKVLVTLTFDVISAGTANIDTIVNTILSTEKGSNGAFTPITNYTLVDSVSINGSVAPTDPPTTPTTAPTTPTVPGSVATVNGKTVNVGDTVTYTVNLSSNQTITGIDAKVNYTNGILKISNSTLNASAATLFPTISSADPVYNFTPNTGESAVYFNVANVDGFNFTSNPVLVTLTFDVVAAGNATISNTINQLIGPKDAQGNFTEATGNTSETLTVNGEVPPVENKAIINGKEVAVGEQVEYTLTLDSDNVIVGIGGFIEYTSGVLAVSDTSLNATNAQLFPVLSQHGALSYNFNPIADPKNRMYISFADATQGFDFTGGQVVVKVVFDVVSAGTGTISENIDELLKYQPVAGQLNEQLQPSEYTFIETVNAI